MKKQNNLSHGVYKIKWKHGGSSVASVGSTHDGTNWFAPANWTSADNKDPIVASTKWKMVKSIKAIITTLLLIGAFNLQAQTTVKKDSSGKYVSIRAVQNKPADKFYGEYQKTGSSKLDTIYETPGGSHYILRTSKRGNTYREYIKIQQ